MDTNSIIAELEAERERLNQAITALRGHGKGKAHNGRRGPSKHSAAARKKISQKLKAIWAQRKATNKK